MTGFGFGTLALLVVAGLVGPLLASVPRLRVPVVVGELLVGILLGKTGFGIIDTGEPTFELLANIGFALVMFVVGTHVPIRDRAMRSAAPAPWCGPSWWERWQRGSESGWRRSSAPVMPRCTGF